MDFYEDVKNNIRKYGQQILCVAPTVDDTEGMSDAELANEQFSYTIGCAVAGDTPGEYPELLIVGLVGNGAGHMLNELRQVMVKRGRPFRDGEKHAFGPGLVPVLIVDADDSVKDDFTIQATRYYGDAAAYRVMQVVLADKAGRYPGEEGCEAPYSWVRVHRRERVLN